MLCEDSRLRWRIYIDNACAFVELYKADLILFHFMNDKNSEFYPTEGKSNMNFLQHASMYNAKSHILKVGCSDREGDYLSSSDFGKGIVSLLLLAS